MHIGNRLRELRQSHGFTLSQLAEKSGVQIATLSRIEHSKMVGSLQSHLNIAKALGVDITALYSHIIEKTAPPPQIIGPTKQAEIFAHNEKASQEFLTGRVLNKKMMPVLLKIEPHGQTNKEQNKPGTERFIFVLEGKIQVHINREAFALSKGNTLYFDSSLEHHFENQGDVTAKVICVCTPVTL